jgi:hypothetical protein
MSMPSLPFLARYQASRFPVGLIRIADDLQFSPSDLVHALFTAGRAPGDRLSYGQGRFRIFRHESTIGAWMRTIGRTPESS